MWLKMTFQVYGMAAEAAVPYFLRKDRQSVHWSWVGLHSWVPTMIRSREQKFSL